MARNSRYATCRIASSINARYFPTEQIADAYYLDGRFTGKREQRAADSTNDREERGFLYAVFAYPTDKQQRAAEAPFSASVLHLSQELNNGNQSIDSQVNDLADLAVEVCGKHTLARDGMRQSYFAGVMIKEAEFAAVTAGSGCAYLYRGDVLYPLTESEFALEPIDFNGNPVDNMDAYPCDSAGSVRYSNISQLQQNDCLVMCNKEVMEALGQREVLRMLYEAEDQEDAAGAIITAAAAKMPGVPMQMMISAVVAITPAEKTGRLTGLLTGAQPTQTAAPDSANDPYAYQVTNKPSAYEPAYTNPASELDEDFGYGQQSDPFAPQANAGYNPGSDTEQIGSDWDDGSNPPVQYTPVNNQRGAYGNNDYVAPRNDPYSAGADYARNQQRGGGRKQVAPRDDYRQDAYDPRYAPQADYEQDYNDGYDDGYDDYPTGNARRGSKAVNVKQIAFYVALLVICAVCIFAIVKLLTSTKKTPTATTKAPAIAQTTLAGAPKGTTIAGAPAGGQNAPSSQVHTVVAGDRLAEIAKKYYGSADQKFLTLLQSQNAGKIDANYQIYIGDQLVIPVAQNP